jgi:hypothetical protein
MPAAMKGGMPKPAKKKPAPAWKGKAKPMPFKGTSGKPSMKPLPLASGKAPIKKPMMNRRSGS